MTATDTNDKLCHETALTTVFTVTPAETSGIVFLTIDDDMEDASFWLTPERARQLAAELIARAEAVS
jgi:hypothetical protein